MRRALIVLAAAAIALFGLLIARSRARRAEPVTAQGPARRPGPTRRELYEQAKRLDIEGRSKMNKAELERAVRERMAPGVAA